MNETSDTQEPAPAPLKKWVVNLLKVAILGVTLVFIGRNVQQAIANYQADAGQLELNIPWLVASALLYAAAVFLLAVPYWVIVRDWGADVPFWPAARAYVVSHLWEVCSGEGDGVFIRIALLKPFGLAVGLLTLTTFYETFATMAAGSIVAGICLVAAPLPSAYVEIVTKYQIGWITLVLIAGFGTATLPHGFQLFTLIVSKPFKGAERYVSHRAAFKTMFIALGFDSASWLMAGVTYLAIINAVSPTPLGMDALPMLTICMALSVVGGFVSMLPGQIGVRDLILIEALKPVVGDTVAVAASLLCRLVTLGVELALGGVVYAVGDRR